MMRIVKFCAQKICLVIKMKNKKGLVKPQTKVAKQPAAKPVAKKAAAQKSTAKKNAPTPDNKSPTPPPPPAPSPPPSEEEKIQQTQDTEQSKPNETPEQLNQESTEIQEPPEEKIYRTIAYDPSSISSFHDLESFELEEYNLKDVPFLTFDGITNLTNASAIFVTNALFTSFKHTSKMPNLKKCSFSGSPIYFRTHYKLMILLAFGEQVEEIDNVPVSNADRRIFRHFNEESIQLLSNYVRSGGIIMQNIDEKFIEELKQKEYLPKFELPIKLNPINHLYYTPFLTKSDIDQFLAKEISQNEKNLKESEEVKNEKEQRYLITSVENEIFDPQNQNKLPSRTDLVKVCDKNDIQKAEDNAFNIIRNELTKILQQLQDSKKQVPKFEGDNFYLSLLYQPILNIIEEAIDKTNSMLASLDSKSRSFSFINKSVKSYYTIFQKSCGFSPIINFLQESYFQLVHSLESYSSIFIPDELRKVEDPQIRFLLKGDIASNIPKLSEIIDKMEDQDKKKMLLENSVIEKIDIQNRAKIVAQNAISNLKKGFSYINLMRKCPNPRYFTSFASICHSSSEIYSKIPDLIQNQNKEGTLNLFSEIESFATFVCNEFDRFVRVNRLIPKYTDFKLAIDQSIGEAKSYLQNFEVEKINLLREKVQKYWEEGNEFQQERLKISDKVDKMLQFILDSHNYQECCETPFLTSDLSAFSEEFILSKDPAKKQQIQDQLKRLDDESDEKDREIRELLAQCAELGINVE